MEEKSGLIVSVSQLMRSLYSPGFERPSPSEVDVFAALPDLAKIDRSFGPPPYSPAA